MISLKAMEGKTMEKKKDTLRDRALNLISHLGDFVNDAVKICCEEILKVSRTIEIAEKTEFINTNTIEAFEKEDLEEIDMFDVVLSNKEHNDKLGN